MNEYKAEVCNLGCCVKCDSKDEVILKVYRDTPESIIVSPVKVQGRTEMCCDCWMSVTDDQLIEIDKGYADDIAEAADIALTDYNEMQEVIKDA